MNMFPLLSTDPNKLKIFFTSDDHRHFQYLQELVNNAYLPHGSFKIIVGKDDTGFRAAIMRPAELSDCRHRTIERVSGPYPLRSGALLELIRYVEDRAGAMLSELEGIAQKEAEEEGGDEGEGMSFSEG